MKLEHLCTDQITFRKKYFSLLFINSSRDVFIFSSVIKMSSPNLNSIIVMGCMLCYADVILIGLDARFLYLEEYTFICNVVWAVLLTVCVKQPLKTKNVTKIFMFHEKSLFQFPFAWQIMISDSQ